MATFDILSTFSTQRYDPNIRRQASSILGSVQTKDATITTHARRPIISPRLSASTITIKEPSSNDQCLRPSTSSSSPSSPRWHEGYSTGVSTLISIENSGDQSSRSTSPLSLPLSSGQHSMAGEDEEKDFATGGGRLVESILSASQVEAHIPSSIDDGHSTTTDEGDTDDEIQGPDRLIIPMSVRQVVTRKDPPQRVRSVTTRRPTNSHCFHQVHPEYDSDYDDYTDAESVSSFFTGSSGFSEREAEENDVVEISDPEIPHSHTTSAPDPPNESSHLDPVIPSFRLSAASSSLSSSPPSPILFRNPGTSIYEEEIHIINAVLKPSRFTRSTRPTSILLGTPEISLDAVALSPPASSAVERNVWWRVFPKHLRRASDGRPTPREREVTVGEWRTETSKAFNSPRGAPKVGDTSSNTEVEPRAGNNPRRPLQPAFPRPPSNTGWYKRSRRKLKLRWILSIILPCIPVPQKEKFGKSIGGSGSTPTRLGSASRGKGLTEKSQGRLGQRGLAKQKSTGTLLEVQVNRQVNRVMDYR